MTDDPRWVIVTGAGLNLTHDEEAAATLLGGLLAREGYSLIAGTWRGVDELVTRAFLQTAPPNEHARRIVHIVNHDVRGHHDIRVGRAIRGDNEDKVSREAVQLADAGVIVSGRQGSKPTMDALLRIGKPVVPLAWLGNDAFGSLQDLLLAGGARRNRKRLLLALIDPACASDETLSRVLGAVLRPHLGIFVSYHRVDTGADAGRIAAQLAATYGNRRVFIDYESLPAAEQIETIIDKAAACRLLVAMIGPHFAERVRDERDYVRREILAAEQAGARILPITVDGTFATLGTLPDALAFLRGRSGIVLERTNWDACMQSIERAADAALGVTPMRPQWAE